MAPLFSLAPRGEQRVAPPGSSAGLQRAGSPLYYYTVKEVSSPSGLTGRPI